MDQHVAEIQAVWRGELSRAVRSGWAVALVVLFLLAEGLLLTVVGYITGATASQVGAANVDALEQKKGLLGALTSYSEATIEQIARLPTLLLVAFGFTTLFAPLLIALMGFDSVAGEVAPRSMRYLIVRVRRTSIVLGKYLTQVTVLSAILALCVLAMVVTAAVMDADFTVPQALTWGARLTLAMVVIGVTYAALTSLCSAVAGSSPLALFLNFIVLFGFWFVSLLANRVRFPGEEGGSILGMTKDASALAYLRYLVPSQYEPRLLSPDLLEYATGLLAYFGFACVFLGLAQVALDRRDL